MQAPTHAAFGLVFVIAAGTVLGVVLTPAVAAFAVLGALFPDVDTPTSLIGKVCLPLARLLERRFGHRTVTHSLLGLALFTGPVTPLALLNPQWPLAFGLGLVLGFTTDTAPPAQEARGPVEEAERELATKEPVEAETDGRPLERVPSR